jgi:diguanylate cyclase (GGDEF)-like protein
VDLLVGLLVITTVVALLLAVAAQRRASSNGRQLEALATHDRLTGLPNRLATLQVLRTQLERDDPTLGHPAVIVIELVRFAAINETYGPEVGDSLLRAVANELGATVRSGEHLARLYGPTLAIVLDSVRGVDEAAARARELRATAAKPYQIGHDRIRIVSRIGVAVADKRGTDAESVLEDAELALHLADQTKDRVGIYLPAMRQQLTTSNAEPRLREAFERGQFWIHYQPVVDLAEHEIVGFEALLRWADPDRGVVSPGEFLSQLDDSGLILPLSWWALEEVCRQSRAWQDRFPNKGLLTSVNLSPRQIDQPDLSARVLEIIEASGVSPDRICLEVTEAGSHHDVDDAWRVLRPAKESGVKLALDDFGAGYSSLRYLRRFQFDVLKIDQGLIQSLGESRADDGIVEQVIGLSHALEIEAVAKGVATGEQADTLRSMRCEFGQGFWFAAPQPADAIDALLAKGKLQPGRGASRHIDWSGQITSRPSTP